MEQILFPEMEQYMAEREAQGIATSTLRQQAWALRRFDKWLREQELEPTEVTHDDLIQYRIACLEKYSVNTWNQYCMHLNGFYANLVSRGKVAFSPVGRTLTVRGEIKMPRIALTPEQVQRLIEVVQKKSVMAATALNTMQAVGLRINEVLNLRVGDIYQDLGIIRLTGKGNRERQVPMSDATALSLQLMAIDKQEGDFVFPTTEWSLRRRFRKGAELVGIPEGYSPHDLRRFFATDQWRRGTALEIIQRILGHANIQTTLRYIRNNTEDLQGYTGVSFLGYLK
jgi:integrase/recombinase XerD